MMIRLSSYKFTGGLVLKKNIVIKTPPAFRRFLNLTKHEVVKKAEKEGYSIDIIEEDE